jgi:hypothetical protein
MIRRRGGSFQVIVYAGKDPLTGRDLKLRESTTDEREAERGSAERGSTAARSSQGMPHRPMGCKAEPRALHPIGQRGRLRPPDRRWSPSGRSVKTGAPAFGGIDAPLPISVHELVHELLPADAAAARNGTRRTRHAPGRRPCGRQRADYGSGAAAIAAELLLHPSSAPPPAARGRPRRAHSRSTGHSSKIRLDHPGGRPRTIAFGRSSLPSSRGGADQADATHAQRLASGPRRLGPRNPRGWIRAAPVGRGRLARPDQPAREVSDRATRGRPPARAGRPPSRQGPRSPPARLRRRPGAPHCGAWPR